MGERGGEDPEMGFSLERAEAAVKVLRGPTGEARRRVEALQSRLSGALPPGEARKVAREIERLYIGWMRAVAMAGGIGRPGWHVDFEGDRGVCWCWRFPEPAIGHVHEPGAEIAGRRPIGPAAGGPGGSPDA